MSKETGGVLATSQNKTKCFSIKIGIDLVKSEAI